MVIVVAARWNGGWEDVSRGGRGLCYGCDGWTKREALHKTEMQTTAGQEAVIRLSAGAGEGTAVGYSSVQSRLDGGHRGVYDDRTLEAKSPVKLLVCAAKDARPSCVRQQQQPCVGLLSAA